MQYKYIFGPILSRRLGISLGVDLVPHKTCSLDCVYCECGKTTDLTCEQKEYVSFKDVARELDHFWIHNDDPDYITFSGSGEPTLNNKLGRIIEYIKKSKPFIKTAVLTNSTLFNDPDVRQALLKADLVIPSLDAVSRRTFIKINRPDRNLDINGIINGIETFAKEYRGEMWLEVLILPGFNNHKSDLILLKEAIKRINPDLIQINTLDRPGTMSDIEPASKNELERVKDILGFDNIEIIAKVDENIKVKPEIKEKDIKASIIKTINRRPCTKQDLLQVLGVKKNILEKNIITLEKEKIILGKPRERGVFYQTIKDKNT
ncbi:MAG: radical SAM protein [Desulfobacula sp.]|nr:radical SAM protein [Desulfobacula sp.]